MPNDLFIKCRVRKFDLRIMPWLFGLYFFPELNRVNMGESSAI